MRSSRSSKAINMATQFSEIVDLAAGKPHEKIRHSSLGHKETLDELWEVWDECRKVNWDGFRAIPVDQETYRAAYFRLESLPLGFPKPTSGAEP